MSNGLRPIGGRSIGSQLSSATPPTPDPVMSDWRRIVRVTIARFMIG